MRINDVTSMWAARYLEFLQNRQSALTQQIAQATMPFNANISSSAISERLRAQMRGYERSMYDVYNAIGMLNVAEGGLNSITTSLQRMRELAVQASSSTLSESDRSALQKEFQQMQQQINKTSQQTQYNNIAVIAGDVRNYQVQTGPNEGQNMSITIGPVNTQTLGIENLNLNSVQNSQNAIEKIDRALEQLNSTRSYIGATTNRLVSAARELSNTMTNITSSVSTLTDTDMARSMMDFIRTQLLTRSTTAMMSYSNLSRLAVLRILGA